MQVHVCHVALYQSFVGRIIFEDKEQFDAVYEKYSGLLTVDDRFISEPGGNIVTPETKTDICHDQLVIQFPYNEYRAASPMHETIVEEASEYGFVWAPYEGMRGAGYKTDDDSMTMSLDDWAKNNVRKQKPIEEDYDNRDQWAQEHLWWKEEVKRSFAKAHKDVIPETPDSC